MASLLAIAGVVAAAVVPSTALAAEPAPGPRRADVALISEMQGIRPAGDFWLGLRVQLRPGWHTYWTNPGDSGEPVRLTWKLPAGIASGDIAWPAPHRLPNPPFADFGYENEVLLLVPMRSAGLGRTASVTLQADVRLLVCKDVCVPERSTVAVTLPVVGSPRKRADVEPLFAAARGRVPGPPPASWRLTARAHNRSVVLAVAADDPPRAAEFFPLRPLEIRHAAPQPLRRSPTRASITLEVDERRRDPPARLTGVLVLERRQPVTVDIPVEDDRPR